MSGHHEVKAFWFAMAELQNQDGLQLPPEWKPFGTKDAPQGVWIIARRWIRTAG